MSHGEVIGISKKRKERVAHDPSKPHFAHESEREFARLLDFYQIQWEYEPRTFTLEVDAEGHPLESFAPDFYLPELDLFIELTTMKQSLVTKKNRKLRHLKELYPDINIKLLYRRDFRTLMIKYGLNPDAALVANAPHDNGHKEAVQESQTVEQKPEEPVGIE